MSSENHIVLVDMDGVMADFDTAALINIPRDEIVESRVLRSSRLPY